MKQQAKIHLLLQAVALLNVNNQRLKNVKFSFCEQRTEKSDPQMGVKPMTSGILERDSNHLAIL